MMNFYQKINLILKKHGVHRKLLLFQSEFQSEVPLSEFNFDNKIYKEKKAVANGFNNFFVNVGPTLAKNIDETEGSIFDTMNNPLKGSFFLEPVTINEV